MIDLKLYIIRGHMSIMIPELTDRIPVASWDEIAQILDAGHSLAVKVEGVSK